jgi:hypothetical protein
MAVDEIRTGEASRATREARGVNIKGHEFPGVK